MEVRLSIPPLGEDQLTATFSNLARNAHEAVTAEEAFMDWTIVEFLKIVVLVVLAAGLHQLIRRFGKSYVAEIFETTPHIGRNFIVLADFAYYLIFAAYILFNLHFERPARYDLQGNLVGYKWEATVSAAQLQDSVFSVAGICMIIGILHGLNVFVLPFVGSILALRARLLQPRHE